MTSKPNACPFCGSDDVMAEINTLEPDGLYCGHVICHGCEAEGPDGMSAPGGTWTDDHDEAVQFAYAAWNRRAAQPAAGEPVAGMAEFLADLARSRGKYPNNARMFDGLLGEVDELRRAYAGDGDVRSEAFDVAVCAFRIATEGDSGGNSALSAPPAAAPVAAGEPVAWECYEPASEWNGYKGRYYLSREKPKGCAVRAVPLGRIAAPPAAAPVAAGEPVAPIGYANPKHLARMAAGEMGSVSVLAERSPDENHTAPVFGYRPAAAHGDEYEIWSAAQLAPGEGIEDGAERIRALICKPAAHGDEAVQYRLLRVGEVIQATDELLRDDCTTWTPMSDGRQLGIGWKWHEGLMPMRRIDAAMRAQGDGETRHG